jgi:hypothetical protein
MHPHEDFLVLRELVMDPLFEDDFIRPTTSNSNLSMAGIHETARLLTPGLGAERAPQSQYKHYVRHRKSFVMICIHESFAYAMEEGDLATTEFALPQDF